MFLLPKKVKYNKSFSGRKLTVKNPKITTNKKNKYSGISLIANEHGQITNFQMEAVRLFLKRFLKKKIQIFFRIFPFHPVTKKPNDIRQGRGKGTVKYWVYKIRKGDVILEISGLESIPIKRILDISKLKLSLKTYVFTQQNRWII